jgi:hypothetical protein
VEKAYDADTKAIERFKKLKAEEIGIYLSEYEMKDRGFKAGGLR